MLIKTRQSTQSMAYSVFDISGRPMAEVRDYVLGGSVRGSGLKVKDNVRIARVEIEICLSDRG